MLESNSKMVSEDYLLKIRDKVKRAWDVTHSQKIRIWFRFPIKNQRPHQVGCEDVTRYFLECFWKLCSTMFATKKESNRVKWRLLGGHKPVHINRSSKNSFKNSVIARDGKIIDSYNYKGCPNKTQLMLRTGAHSALSEFHQNRCVQ